MRIAFVGKGGAGKTSLCALFSQYARRHGKPVLVVDADINMHVPALLGFEEFPAHKHLSHPDASAMIRGHLIGANPRIRTMATFRKTTPPGPGSNLVLLGDESDPLQSRYAESRDGLGLMVVGTYQEGDVGASCYHNHLAIFENILTHLADDEGILVADMVAGVDSFASTLHAQFDLMVLAVEPTRRSVEVYAQYAELARGAGCLDALAVVGNKVRTEEDRQFIADRVPADRIIGFIGESDYLRNQDKTSGVLDIDLLEDENRRVIEDIFRTLAARPFEPQKRLEKIYDLHAKYVGQAFIRERFGDLTDQIDPTFDYMTELRKLRERK